MYKIPFTKHSVAAVELRARREFVILIALYSMQVQRRRECGPMMIDLRRHV